MLVPQPRSTIGTAKSGKPMDERKPDGAFEALCRQWDGVRVGFDEFSRHVAELGIAGTLPRYAGSVYVCCACALNRPGARRALERRHAADLDAALVGLRSPALRQELSRRARQALFDAEPPLVASYSGQVPLGAWLRVCVLRIVQAEARHAARRTSGSEVAELEADRVVEWLGPSAVAVGRDASRSSRFGALVMGALAGLPARDLTLLRLHLAHGMSLGALTRACGLQRSELVARLERCRVHLLGRVETFATQAGEAGPNAGLGALPAGELARTETRSREPLVTQVLASAASSGVRRAARALDADIGARG